MEKKERFELFGEHCIKDNNPDARPQLFDACVACVILNEQYKHIKDLEAKLAEKDKRIKKLNLEAQKYYEDAYCNDFHNQDKISFAVEQIVKTKEILIKFLQDEGFYENEWYDLFDEIDNQIKQLKEGQDV